MRIVCFLNVSALGLIDFRFSELSDPNALSAEDALATARANPHVVRGFKLRLSEEVVGRACRESLRLAEAIARDAALPLMVHIGDTAEPLPVILDELSAGDVVSHCYTGKAEGILGDRGVLREVLQARHRGVLFDSAHGKSNLSFRVAKTAIDQGFLPDVISSDTSRRNWHGPVFDLVTTMSKMLALGMSIEDVILRTTQRPATVLGIADEGYGRLRVGDPANVTVLGTTGPAVLVDAEGEELVADRLEPVAAIVAGERVDLAPWRGSAMAESAEVAR
jgi:dihydroorotase